MTLSSFEVELDLKFKLKGKTIIDLKTAKLLFYIDKLGKILPATKIMGIPYSEAIFLIKRAEKTLGKKLVIRRKGGSSGGSAILTPEAKSILNIYINILNKLGINLDYGEYIPSQSDLVIMGSDDPILRTLLDKFSQKVLCEYHIVGSLLGILHLVLSDSDIIVAHLYDPETEEYNIPYIRRLGLTDEVTVYRGFLRTLVLASRSINCESMDDCITKNKTIALRGKGSGTYHLIKHLLGKNFVTQKSSTQKPTKKQQI